jgi:predicted O-methyltransferase YrrM
MRKVRPKSYDYIEKLATPESSIMHQARKNSEALGLQTISVSATEAALIKFHLESISAVKVVEIGTLTGLSALHILSVLPANGKLWSIEKSQEHFNLAAQVLQQEMTEGRCQILLGDAKEKLAELKNIGPFDAVFIDGNKAAYLDYFNWAFENIRPGGLVIVDNVFLAGAVWGGETTQRFNAKQIKTVQDMNQLAFTNRTLSSVIVPTEEGLLICKKQF